MPPVNASWMWRVADQEGGTTAPERTMKETGIEWKTTPTDKEIAASLPSLTFEQRVETILRKFVGGIVSRHHDGENTAFKADGLIARDLMEKLRKFGVLPHPSEVRSANPSQEDPAVQVPDAETQAYRVLRAQISTYDLDVIVSSGENWDEMYSYAQLESTLRRIRPAVRAANEFLDALTSERTRVQELEAQVVRLKRAVDGHPSAQIIQRAMSQIEHSYEVSEVGRDNGGFPSKLENYIHQIWKREPRVQAVEQERDKAVEWADTVTRGKSLCGHWKAYTHTEDGGRRIDCWQCQCERSEATNQTLRAALAASRDAMAAFGRQAGWLPEQGGYSTRMTEPEKQLADAVASIDLLLADATRKTFRRAWR
jgi:hypothetical protein